MVNTSEADAELTFSNLKETEAWHCLTAAQNGNVYVVPFDKWWMYSPLAVDGQLKEAAALFRKSSVS